MRRWAFSKSDTIPDLRFGGERIATLSISAGLAQLEELPFCKRWVRGSSPLAGTKILDCAGSTSETFSYACQKGESDGLPLFFGVGQLARQSAISVEHLENLRQSRKLKSEHLRWSFLERNSHGRRLTAT